MPDSLETILARLIIRLDRELADIKNELEALKANIDELEQQEGGENLWTIKYRT